MEFLERITQAPCSCDVGRSCYCEELRQYSKSGNGNYREQSSKEPFHKNCSSAIPSLSSISISANLLGKFQIVGAESSSSPQTETNFVRI